MLKNTWGNGKLEKLILEKLEQSETGRERFVTTDLNVLKAVRNLGNQGLVQWKVKMQPAQPLGLIVHDDQLNTVSDWAEKMVCQIIDAEQTAWNCKGHDGVLADGTKVEIKYVSWSWDSFFEHWEFRVGQMNKEKTNEFDLLIICVSDENNPNIFGKAAFYVLDREAAKKAIGGSKKRIKVIRDSNKHKWIDVNCKVSFAELAELKHGYEHFLKMKGKVPPIEPPKESIQYVVDVWKPNKFNLMPYDKRYEDSSWFAEFAVAQLLGGTVTEQRCAGFDVLMEDGLKVSVKRAKKSINNRHKNGKITPVTVFNSLKKDSDYDLMVGLYWEDREVSETNDITEAKTLIMPKVAVDKLKTKYYKNDDSNGFIKLWKNPKKLKPFMFTIDHLAELGEIGYEQFYLKYLKEPCEKVLGVEIKNGSDDSNGNQIDLKPKFPIQRKISKRTNQADQRSA